MFFHRNAVAVAGLLLVSSCRCHVQERESSAIPKGRSAGLNMGGGEFDMPVDFRRTVALSDEEFMREHERLKKEMGDEQYLAMRKAEMGEKGDIIARELVGSNCMADKVHTPERDEMDVRLTTVDGREFKVGKGVPEEASQAIQGIFEQYERMPPPSMQMPDEDFRLPPLSVEMPEELLQYEVTKEQQQKEQEDEERETSEARARQDAEILSGKLSVRDMRSPCDCEKK